MSALFALAIGVNFLAHWLAQDGTASLTGKLQVQVTGEALQNAEVELKAESSGRSHRAKTDSSGLYRFSGLDAGEFTLQLWSPGFKRVIVKSIRVSAEEQKSLPLLELDLALFGSCGSPFASLDYIRLLPSGTRVGKVGGSIRLFRGMVGETSTLVGAGSDVTLICGSSRACGVTKANSSGEFIFQDLAPGDYKVRVLEGFYPTEVPGYMVQEGRERIYSYIGLERCHQGNCDPKLRPQKPIAICE